MYVRTSFTGAKTCKIGENGVFFGHVHKFWRGHDITEKTRKKSLRNAYIGHIFIPWKYVLRVFLKVLLRGWYPAWNTSAPPPDNNVACLESGKQEIMRDCEDWLVVLDEDKYHAMFPSEILTTSRRPDKPYHYLLTICRSKVSLLNSWHLLRSILHRPT